MVGYNVSSWTLNPIISNCLTIYLTFSSCCRWRAFVFVDVVFIPNPRVPFSFSAS